MTTHKDHPKAAGDSSPLPEGPRLQRRVIRSLPKRPPLGPPRPLRRVPVRRIQPHQGTARILHVAVSNPRPIDSPLPGPIGSPPQLVEKSDWSAGSGGPVETRTQAMTERPGPWFDWGIALLLAATGSAAVANGMTRLFERSF